MTDDDFLDLKVPSPEQMTKTVLDKVTEGSMHNVKRASPTEGNDTACVDEASLNP